MKTTATLLAAAAVTALAFAPGAQAADAEGLAKSSGCLACHTVDKKLVGPCYKDVADKYRKDKNAEAALVKKVKEGGKGNWGDIPMPPNGHVKDADIKTLVDWILSLK